MTGRKLVNMRSANYVRFCAIRDIIDAFNAACRRGSDWYHYSDPHFSAFVVYYKIGAISKTEYEMAFTALNHCFWRDCEDLRPYFVGLLDSVSLTDALTEENCR